MHCREPCINQHTHQAFADADTSVAIIPVAKIIAAFII